MQLNEQELIESLSIAIYKAIKLPSTTDDLARAALRALQDYLPEIKASCDDDYDAIKDYMIMNDKADLYNQLKNLGRE